MTFYSQQDIIDSALFELGYGVIDVEVQKYAPDGVQRIYKKSLEDVNLYLPEIREDTYYPIIQDTRNGYADITDYYRDGRKNDPSGIIDVAPTGLSFYERNIDIGILTFNRFIYTFEPGIDNLLLENFKSRKRLYGVDFKFRYDRTNFRRVYFDDLPYNTAYVTVVYLNNWQPDPGYYQNGTTLNCIYGQAATKLIGLLSARLKKATGAIRSKLSGGDRAAVLDGQSMVQQGDAEEQRVMQELSDAALIVGYRSE